MVNSSEYSIYIYKFQQLCYDYLTKVILEFPVRATEKDVDNEKTIFSLLLILPADAQFFSAKVHSAELGFKGDPLDGVIISSIQFIHIFLLYLITRTTNLEKWH